MAERSSPREYFRNKKRYRETGFLGKGGMATVSESNDEYFQRPLAYKELKPGPSLPRRTKEFVREALIMGQLEHPGILPVHALIMEEGELPAMTMDKVIGKSMAEIITEAKKDPEKWPLARRYRIFQRLVEIVAYTHNRGILHRDLKPANVMIGDQEKVILLDWGLAKVMKKKEVENEKDDDANAMEELKSGQQSVSGSIKGTPFYMSPEAAQGRVERVREMTDVFSLGAIFYEMLTLERFVKGEKVNEVLKNAAESNYASLNREQISRLIQPAGNRISEEWHHVLKKMVEPERQKRYRDASALYEDITAIFEERTLDGFKSSIGLYSMKKFFSRQGMLVLMTFIPLTIALLWGMGLGGERKLLDQKNEELEQVISDLERNIEGRESQVADRERELEDLENEIDELSKESVEMQDLALGYQDTTAKETIDQEKLNRDIEMLDQEISFLEARVAIAKDEAEEKRDLFNMDKHSARQKESETRQELFFRNTREHGLEVTTLFNDVNAGKAHSAIRKFQRTYFYRDDPLVSPWIVKVLKAAPSEGQLEMSELPWWDALREVPEWSSSQTWDTEGGTLSRWPGLPPGYRVVKGGEDEKKWLIAFLSPSRIKYREFDPETEDKGEPWNLEGARPRAGFPAGEGGWLILDDDGDLFIMEQDLPPRPLRKPLGLPVDRVFTVPDLNLIVAQDSGNNLLHYYLNTGQWLFHSGQTETPLEEVGVDDRGNLYLVEEGGRSLRPSL